MNRGDLLASASVLLTEQKPSKSTALNDSLIRIHHLVAFADATTSDNLLDGTLLVIKTPHSPNT